MPKPELHNWGRTALIVLTIACSAIGSACLLGFTAKGWVGRIDINTANIVKLDDKAEENEDNIHILQLKERDASAMKEQTLGVLRELKSGMTTIGDDVSDIKTNVAVQAKEIESVNKRLDHFEKGE